MKTRIVRETDQTFLIPEDYSAGDQDYTLNMARNCPLGNLLACDTWFCDGENRLRYTVTGLAPLSQRFSDIPLRSQEIRNILYSLRDTCLRLPDYLLDSEDLLLDPGSIFVSPGDMRVSFCYLPGLHKEEPASRKLLAEFLIRHADHGDTGAVDLAYAFYECASDENCVLAPALSALLQKYSAAPSRAPGHASSPVRGESSGIRGGSSDIRGGSSDIRGGSSDTRGGSSDTRGGSSDTHGERFDACGEGENFDAFGSSRSHPAASRKPFRNSSIMENGQDDFSFFETDCPSPHPAVPKAVRREQAKNKHRLAALAVLSAIAAACLAFLFRLDAAQIGGIGFLSAAIIWLVRQQQYKKSGDLRNIWSDEEEQMEDDDTFYRSLLNEVYSESTDSVNIPQTDAGAESSAPGSNTRYPAPSLSKERAVSGMAAEPSDASGPALVSLEPDRYNDIPLQRSLILIGKNARECDICLRFDTVSRVHAKVEKIGADFYLTDLFSTNGTFVDGRPLEPNHTVMLTVGSEVAFARCRYRFAP